MRPFLPFTRPSIDAESIAAVADVFGILSVCVRMTRIDEAGRPKDARIVSSPSSILNSAALAAARAMTYSPAIYRCVPSPQGRALFRADFLNRRY